MSILVNTFDDVVGDEDGVTSLREAISQAASSPGPDTIILPQTIGEVQGIYTLSIGTLEINDPDPLTIQSSAGQVVLDAQGSSQVFSIGFETNVTINGLAITGGYAFDSGGGIYNQGVLTLRDSTLTANTAAYSGGGLYNGYSGTAMLERVLVQDNACLYGSGGGAFNDNGTLSVADCTLTGNSALYLGGGLYGFLGSTTITDSTVSGNSAGAAAGIYTADYSGAVISGNTITGNQGDGLVLGGYYALVRGNTITGNTGAGVLIDQGSYNTIGTPELGNTITGNTGAGVSVAGDYAFANSIRGNVINTNGGLAVDLGGDGPTANDPGDADFGANNLQNAPVVVGFATGTTTRVVGTLNSTPFETFTIDVYANSATPPVNPGQSTRYLGSFDVTTDASGDAWFDVTLNAASSPGEIITATATDLLGNTSEFSELRLIQVTPTSGLYTSESGAQAKFSVVLASAPSANVVIPLSSSNPAEGTASVSSLTFTPGNWSVPQVVTVTGGDDAAADGPISYTLVTGPAVSADPVFNGLDSSDVQITNFDNDFAPLASVQPAGSLIYRGELDGIVSSGTTQFYSITVDPGQTITVVVVPEGTDLRPAISLYREGKSRPIATATAGSPGQAAVIQTIDTRGWSWLSGSEPSTYQIKVSGAANTTGLYHVRVILNAAVEDESHDGLANDDPGAAQNLEPSFLPLGGILSLGASPDRGAVLGRTDASTPDYYAFSLVKGESVTLGLTGLSAGDLTLTLEDSRGTVLATGRSGATNLSQVIDNFVAPKRGKYYVRIGGTNPDGTDYSLVVTRNASFDTETNDSFATAQDLDGSTTSRRTWALGAIKPAGTYTTSAQDYGFVDISTTGHAILQGSDDGAEFLSAADLAGFTFTLYGSTSDSLYINANGYLYQPGSQGATVYALYQDLVVSGAPDSAVFWQVLDTGAQRQLVVQWNNVGFYGYSTDPITFEVVLSADGSVRFNFKDLQTDNPYVNEGLNATVGIAGYPAGEYASLFLPTFDAPNDLVGTGRSTLIAQPPAADYYRITVEENTSLRIKTMTPASQSGEFANNLDPVIRLYDASGNLVAWDDNSGGDGVNARLSYKVPKGKGGTYYIMIDASPNTAAPTQGEYILAVRTGGNQAFRNLMDAVDEIFAEGVLNLMSESEIEALSWFSLLSPRRGALDSADSPISS